MKNRNPEDLETVSEKLKIFFRERPEAMAACVFGSVARGTAGPLSDVDVAVLLDEARAKKADESYGYQASLLADLMSLLRSNEVDLVLLNEAPPLLAHRVLRDGRFFHVANESVLSEFRLRTLQRYLDTKPLRQAQEAALAQRIASGRFAAPD